MTSKYCLTPQSGTIIGSKNEDGTSSSLPLIEIADFNRDSMFDLLFVTKEGEITILYNQLEAPSDKTENLCADVFTTQQIKASSFFATYPFADDNPKVFKGKISSWDDSINYVGIHPSLTRANPAPVPGRARVIDLNLDSFPDIVLTLDFYDTTNKSHFTKTTIIMNESNDEDNFGSLDRKYTRLSKDSDSPLAEIIKQAGDTGSFVAGIDIDEDGAMDIVLQKMDETMKQPHLVMLYNSVDTDAYFMKALMVNSEQLKDNNIYTDNTVGASYRFVVTSTSDEKLVIASSQAY